MESRLDEIAKQIRVLEAERRVIHETSNKEFEESNRNHYFNNVHGKIFIVKTNPYDSGGGLYILRTTGCTTFSQYNSCDCIKISLCFNVDKTLRSFSFHEKDTIRVDMLITEATKEDLLKWQEFLEIGVNNFLKIVTEI